jgi:hypothetical protein
LLLLVGEVILVLAVAVGYRDGGKAGADKPADL